jgi:serine/threonine protein phosphatase 1
MADIRPGDRIIYLGNYSGYGPSPVKTLEELLTFRRMVLSIPGMLCKDIVYLRGAQE